MAKVGEKANAKNQVQANLKVNVDALEHGVVNDWSRAIKTRGHSSAVQHFGRRFKCRAFANIGDQIAVINATLLRVTEASKQRLCDRVECVDVVSESTGLILD